MNRTAKIFGLTAAGCAACCAIPLLFSIVAVGGVSGAAGMVSEVAAGGVLAVGTVAAVAFAVRRRSRPACTAGSTVAPAPAPIACTLDTGDYRERLAAIAALGREALRGWERQGLVLTLRYAPEAAARVRQMVAQEEVCCPFLVFELAEGPHEVRLTVTAPEAASGAADELFAPLVGSAPPQTGCGCS
jgi:hypothetical protein